MLKRITAFAMMFVLIAGLVYIDGRHNKANANNEINTEEALATGTDASVYDMDEEKAETDASDESSENAYGEENEVTESEKDATESEEDVTSEETTDETQQEDTDYSENENMPYFHEEKTVDGVTVSVTAEEGTFPESAYLVVKTVSSAVENEVNSAIDAKRGDVNVASSYTFDIKVVGRDGIEVQPADGKAVQVSFAMAEVANENLDTAVYHIEDEALTVDKLDVSVSGDTATASSDGFSYYTVEFTYDEKQYVMNGDTTIPLSDILDYVGLVGEVSAVYISNEELFSASNESGEWMITAHQAFHTNEWMKVTIDWVEYEIVVTDATSVKINGMNYEGLVFKKGAEYTFSTDNNVNLAFVAVSNGKTYSLANHSSSNTCDGTIDTSGKLTITKHYGDAETHEFELGTGYNAWKIGRINGSPTFYYFYRTNISVNPTYTAPTAKTMTYTGSSQTLVNTGSVSAGGTMEYALGTSDSSAPTSGWSTTAPTGTDAGTYYVWWRINEASGYNAVAATCLTSTISQATNSWTTSAVKQDNWTYSNSNSNKSLFKTVPVAKFGSVQYSYKKDNGNYGNYATTVPSVKDAGTYTVRYKVDGTNNYTALSGEISVTVSKAGITPGVSIDNWIYGNTASTPSVTGNTGSGTVTYSYKVNGANDNTYSTTRPTNAGNYTVKASIDATTNYNAGSATKDFTISKKNITVSGITASNKTYDGNTTAKLVTNNATFSGKLSGDTLTVSATGTFDNKNVGTGKTVTISGLTLGGASAGNYQLASSGQQTSTTANITAKALTITADAKSKTYGASDPSLTYTSNGLVIGDSITGSLSRSEGEDVGTYAITQGTLTAGNNYSITYTGANLTINKKTLNIAAVAKSKTYGEDDPTLTYTASGFENGDTSSVITGSLSRAVGENVGTYAINKNTLSAGNNYTINYTDANLTIEPKEVGLTWSVTEFTYDGTEHKPIATATGLESGDTCTVTVSGGQTNAGNHTAKASGLSNNNYKLPTDNTQDFVINKKSIVGATVTLGTALTYTGSQQTQTVSSVVIDDITLAGTDYDISGNTGTEAGNYTLTITAKNNSNFSGSVTKGWSISLENMNVTASGFNGKYDGEEHNITVNAPEGAAITYCETENGTYTTTNPTYTNAGTYTVYYKVEKENYNTATGSATVIISKRDVTLTSASDSKTYDKTALMNDNVTVGGDGFVNGEGAAFTVIGAQTNAGSSENVFTYTLNAGTDANNYEITKTYGTLTVNKKIITIASGVTANDKVYDGTYDATFDYLGIDWAACGMIDGDELSVTATGTYDDYRPDTGIGVTITGWTLSGTSAENYEIAATGNQTSFTADITIVDGVVEETIDNGDGTTTTKETTYKNGEKTEIKETTPNQTGDEVTEVYKTPTGETTKTVVTETHNDNSKTITTTEGNNKTVEEKNSNGITTDKVVTIDNSDGSTTVTDYDYDNDGNETDKTATTTKDNKTIDKVETANNPDGSTTVTDHDYDDEGNETGSRSETTDKNGNKTNTVDTTINPDGSTEVVDTDYNESGDIIKTEKTDTAVDGSKTITTTEGNKETVEEKNPTGKTTDKVETENNSDGSTTVTDHDYDDEGSETGSRSETTDKNGNKTNTVDTTINPDGSTEVVDTDYNESGDVIKTEKTDTAVDGSKTITTTEGNKETVEEKNPTGKITDKVETENNSDGSTTVTDHDYDDEGTETGSKSETKDKDGNKTNTVETTYNPDGSKEVVKKDYDKSGDVIKTEKTETDPDGKKTITTTEGNKITVEKKDEDGTTTDKVETEDNPDGSKTVTDHNYDEDGNETDNTETTTKDDKTVDRKETTYNPDGTTTVTDHDYDDEGNETGSKSETNDKDGNKTNTVDTTINPDGSKEVVEKDYDKSGDVIKTEKTENDPDGKKTITTTEGDKETVEKKDKDGTTTDKVETEKNPDGTTTVTDHDYDDEGNETGSKSETKDKDGNKTNTVETTINSDGSKEVVEKDYNKSGDVIKTEKTETNPDGKKTITTTEGDKETVEKKDEDGTTTDKVVTKNNSDGSRTVTDYDYDDEGKKTGSVETTTKDGKTIETVEKTVSDDGKTRNVVVKDGDGNIIDTYNEELSEKGNASKYVKKKNAAPATSLNNSVDNLADMLLTDEEKADYQAGDEVEFFITVEDVSGNLSENEKSKISSAIDSDEQIGMYLDINLFKKIGDSEQIKITDVDGKINISVKIPDSLISKDANVQRTYQIVICHDGKAKVINSVTDLINMMISFETDGFSIYTITYKDKDVSTANDTQTEITPSTPTTPASVTPSADKAAAPATNVQKAPVTGDRAPIKEVIMLIMFTMLAGMYLTIKRHKIK